MKNNSALSQNELKTLYTTGSFLNNNNNNMKHRCSIQFECLRSYKSFKNKGDRFHINQQTGPLRG